MNSRRRLVHVFPSFAGGGPEVRTCVLINAMPEFAHTVVSLNGERSGFARLERQDDIQFRALEGHGGLGNLRKLGAALAAERPNLVVTYGWGGTDAILALRTAGVRRPVHVEDGFLPDEATEQKFARLQIRRLAFRFAAMVVVPSKTLERIADKSWWLPRHHVRYVPNGVDTLRFRPANESERTMARQQVGAAADEVVIGTVAGLRPDKNHLRLIRAVAAVSATHPIRLVIIGEGAMRPELEQEARNLGVAARVVLPGGVVDPSACYHGFDVFALTSNTEQMPLSVLEAMAAALPVVSTDVGDVRSMLPVDGGLIAPLGDDDELARCLAHACSDAAWRARAGARNREHALAEFSLTKMIEAHRGLLQKYSSSSQES